ncbi:DUF502 domain-containing protein [Aquabacterium sp. CECT 9606]|uniref:DUF502 domain-containing protein n=1 Tax=Aquabacterium sp. CECT 9606 TaxID=2845822 RepID=UPI001E4978A5|nr:DUF502 domain-containing protein [Aquabacterium sp. CECT 9606]CAH0354668.1 hypothetical protein AQB9606_03880 [Aquabacterium sp. CECT 9606]
MKKYILTGLLVWLPLTITIWVMLQVLGVLDGVFAGLIVAAQTVLPESLRPGLESLRTIPGLSAIVMVSVLLLTGLAVTNFAGQWILNQSNRVFSNIPIVKSIYTSVKQVSDTLFSSSGQAFRHAVLVQYPRAGSWTIGFVTGKPSGEVASHLSDDHLTLYVPTTPNPTSGFMLIVPRSDVIELQMSVDEALKYIISMGVVAPPPHLVVDNTTQRSHTG